MKAVIATTFAAMMAATSLAYAADNGTNIGADSGGTTTGTMTDDATTGSIKCDDSNANINSGCDKPGHLKQQDHMKQDQDQQ